MSGSGKYYTIPPAAEKERLKKMIKTYERKYGENPLGSGKYYSIPPNVVQEEMKKRAATYARKYGSGKYYNLPLATDQEAVDKRVKTYEERYGMNPGYSGPSKKKIEASKMKSGGALVGGVPLGGGIGFGGGEYYSQGNNPALEAIHKEAAAKNPWVKFMKDNKQYYEDHKAEYGHSWINFVEDYLRPAYEARKSGEFY